MMPVIYRASFSYLLRHPWQLFLSLLGIVIGVAAAPEKQRRRAHQARDHAAPVNAMRGGERRDDRGQAGRFDDHFRDHVAGSDRCRNGAIVADRDLRIIETAIWGRGQYIPRGCQRDGLG